MLRSPITSSERRLSSLIPFVTTLLDGIIVLYVAPTGLPGSIFGPCNTSLCGCSFPPDRLVHLKLLHVGRSIKNCWPSVYELVSQGARVFIAVHQPQMSQRAMIC